MEVNYYAVIPATVRYADIQPNAKLLYGEITALADKTGYCWATDRYFAGLYDVSQDTVNRWIRSLKDIWAIEVDTSNGEKWFERRIFIGDPKRITGKTALPPPPTKMTEPSAVFDGAPPTKMTELYNTNTSTWIIQVDTNIEVSVEKQFETFWNLYWKKVERKNCFTAFKRLKKSEVEKVLEVVRYYVASTPDIQFRKNPLTWLHGRCWEDEIIQTQDSYFWLLEWYDDEIRDLAIRTIDSKSGWKPTEDLIRSCLYQSIIEVERKRMPKEKAQKVRDLVNEWRMKNDYASYQETPLSVTVSIINSVKWTQ